MKFHERVLPENQRSLIGLQASAREWRREECFNLLSKYADNKSNLAGQSAAHLQSNKNLGPRPITAGIKKGDDAEEYPPSIVFSTAHHADDQNETVLLKFLRGAYITNLQPVSGHPYSHPRKFFSSAFSGSSV